MPIFTPARLDSTQLHETRHPPNPTPNRTRTRTLNRARYLILTPSSLDRPATAHQPPALIVDIARNVHPHPIPSHPTRLAAYRTLYTLQFVCLFDWLFLHCRFFLFLIQAFLFEERVRARYDMCIQMHAAVRAMHCRCALARSLHPPARPIISPALPVAVTIIYLYFLLYIIDGLPSSFPFFSFFFLCGRGGVSFLVDVPVAAEHIHTYR